MGGGLVGELWEGLVEQNPSSSSFSLFTLAIILAHPGCH